MIAALKRTSPKRLGMVVEEPERIKIVDTEGDWAKNFDFGTSSTAFHHDNLVVLVGRTAQERQFTSLEDA